jgi:hypothetical protein
MPTALRELERGGDLPGDPYHYVIVVSDVGVYWAHEYKEEEYRSPGSGCAYSLEAIRQMGDDSLCRLRACVELEMSGENQAAGLCFRI